MTDHETEFALRVLRDTLGGTCVLSDPILISRWDDGGLTSSIFAGVPPICDDGSETHIHIWHSGDYDGTGDHERDARDALGLSTERDENGCYIDDGDEEDEWRGRMVDSIIDEQREQLQQWANVPRV